MIGPFSIIKSIHLDLGKQSLAAKICQKRAVGEVLGLKPTPMAASKF
jgi:hypothetical protein